MAAAIGTRWLATRLACSCQPSPVPKPSASTQLAATANTARGRCCRPRRIAAGVSAWCRSPVQGRHAWHVALRHRAYSQPRARPARDAPVTRPPLLRVAAGQGGHRHRRATRVRRAVRWSFQDPQCRCVVHVTFVDCAQAFARTRQARDHRAHRDAERVCHLAITETLHADQEQQGALLGWQQRQTGQHGATVVHLFGGCGLAGLLWREQSHHRLPARDTALPIQKLPVQKANNHGCRASAVCRVRHRRSAGSSVACTRSSALAGSPLSERAKRRSAGSMARSWSSSRVSIGRFWWWHHTVDALERG